LVPPLDDELRRWAPRACGGLSKLINPGLARKAETLIYWESFRLMSLGQQLAPHLPFLRRYGRALTGSQSHGDKYVRATLEAIVAAPEEFPRDVDPRLGLYRTFQAIWGSTNDDQQADPGDVDDQEAVARARLARMTPLSRQALLLTAMEGFTVEDTAYLINVSPSEVESLVADALSEIENQTRARVLIIEDAWTRAQLGVSPGSASSASTAARSAVMSPISSIAIARLLSAAATRRPARASVSAIWVMRSVANTAMIASGSSAIDRITRSFAPVGQRIMNVGVVAPTRESSAVVAMSVLSLACPGGKRTRPGPARRSSSDRLIAAPHPCPGPWTAPQCCPSS